MHNEPLAYFITFTTYGTWLHGDERKSVKIEDHRPTLVEPQESFQEHQKRSMKYPAVILNKPMRQIVCDAIIERCLWKEWRLYAAHIRSNHVHVLVQSSDAIDKVMISLKIWATKKLREHGYNIPKVWTHHGSTKYVFTKDKMFEKVHYVIHEQGEKMAYYIDENL